MWTHTVQEGFVGPPFRVLWLTHVEETRELRQKIQYDLRDQGRDGDKERIGTEGRCGHEEVTLEAGFQGPGTIPGNAMLTSAMAAAGNRQLIPSLEGLVGQGRYI